MFFVDDIIGLYQKEKRQKAYEFRDALNKDMCLGEVKWFLDVRVLRNRDELKGWLCQSCVKRVAHRYSLDSMKPLNTPMGTEEVRTRRESRKIIAESDSPLSAKSWIFVICYCDYPP
jgi:hypothetical protein